MLILRDGSVAEQLYVNLTSTSLTSGQCKSFHRVAVLRLSPLAFVGTCVFEAPVTHGTTSCVTQRGYHERDTAG
jgi:hypothetical protein